MLRVLLVDDEPFITKGLSILIDWEKEGYQIVGICENGEEALQFLQRYFQVSREETMVFGDNANDIGLMQAASESYAVANARAEVQAAAREVCPSYSEDGVLQILKGIVSESRK